MKNSKTILVIVLMFLMAACSTNQTAPPSSNDPIPAATEDIQATIDAGIASTMQAEANMQATIDAAVTATVGAAEALNETYVSEEELAEEIDLAVEEAVAASEEIAYTTAEMAADGTISEDEYAELEELLVEAAILLDYADYWIENYYYYYGDLAEETLYLLEEIEEVLYYTEEYYDELIALLETGNQIADTTLDAMLEIAQNAEENAAALDEKAEEWQAQAATWQEERANAIANIQANNIPADRAAAIEEAFNYLDTLRSSLEDRVISADELQNIAQIGANAVAGLETHGGAALQGISGNISQLTQQAALGQLEQLSSGLGSFEASLPNLPGRP